MAKLNSKEQAWVGKVNKLLKECPSKRIGFYTIGDNNLRMFDVRKNSEIYNEIDNGRASDFHPAVENIDAGFGEELWFPNPVESTAG